jgi:hypothetical protein
MIDFEFRLASLLQELFASSDRQGLFTINNLAALKHLHTLVSM